MALNLDSKRSSNAHIALLAQFCAGLVLIALWRIYIAANLPLSVDEAYYVAWSKSPDWGYWTKPPLIAWGIGLARFFCGESAICVRSTTLIAFPLTSCIMLVLAWRMGQSLKLACILGLLFATIPLSSFYGIAATTDAFLLLMWASSMLCLWLALEGKYWAWPVLGLVFGLGLLAKYTMVVFGASALLILLHPQWRSHWRTSGPYLALLVAMLVFSPNVYWNISHQMPTFQHTADISQGSNQYGLHWDTLGTFLAEQVLIGNPILVIAFLFAAFQFLKIPRNQQAWFSLSASLPILLVICFQALISRAHANWAAPAYLGVALLALSHLRDHAPKLIGLAFLFNLVFASILYHYQALVAKPMDLKGTQSSDPFWAVRNWPVLNDLIAQELGAHLSHSQWRIASEDRAVLAQFQMSQGLAPGYALGWQRNAAPDNHFDQHFPLSPETNRPVLLVTHVSREEVLQYFPSAVWAKEIRADTMPVDPLRYQLWWLNP